MRKLLGLFVGSDHPPTSYLAMDLRCTALTYTNSNDRVWQVIRMETYDTKCDVYSFAVLLWEILCLKQAFKGLTPTEFVERVVTKRERMTVPKTLPSLVRLLLPEAWDDQPMRRPDMKRVAILIRGDLNDLTHDDQVLNRTNHMDDRSVDSLRGGGE